MADLVPVRRALISAHDKTGLGAFARALQNEFDIELVSTGGTAAFLRDAGLRVTDVAQLTQFPEMMGGRVKTLHPAIHAAILARRDDTGDLQSLRECNIAPIDLVCVNLYPFEQTIARPDATFDQAIEQIDVGGPAMIRAAAKNHRWVLVVTSPDRYEKALGDLRQHAGSTCGKHRLKQAQAAFAATAAYDRAIADYLQTHVAPGATADATASWWSVDRLDLSLRRAATLRYGENPHQAASLYVSARPAEASVAFARQLHGKELSYVNLLDADAALDTVKEFSEPAAVIVKHATPCGCAEAADLATAFARAYDGDPLAAFGGIVALNRSVDAHAADAIGSIDRLLEVIVAPDFHEPALALLGSRWKNVRLLATGDASIGPAQRDGREAAAHKIVGGWLIQQRDLRGVDRASWKCVTKRPPTESESRDLAFALLVAKHVKSNAIVLAHDRMLIGAGAGQMDRPSSARLAIAKAGDRLAPGRGVVGASDAFFPFPDALELLLAGGVGAVIQPGGSVRDRQVIDAADRAGAAMIFCGDRHFRH